MSFGPNGPEGLVEKQVTENHTAPVDFDRVIDTHGQDTLGRMALGSATAETPASLNVAERFIGIYQVPLPEAETPETIIRDHIDRAHDWADILAVKGEESGEADRTQEVFAVRQNEKNRFLVDIISKVHKNQYLSQTSRPVRRLLKRELKPLKGKTVVNLSATAVGGGVSMQLPPEIILMRQYGINALWLIPEPDEQAFRVTKDMHNGQQGMVKPGTDFTEEQAQKHINFGDTNIEGMLAETPELSDPDAEIIMHDPQLAGGLHRLMEANPTAHYLYRNHIQTDRKAPKGSLKDKIMRHIHERCGVDLVRTYIGHPVDNFFPDRTGKANYQEAVQPPVGDIFENLNRKQSPELKADKRRWLDGQRNKQNRLRRIQNAEELGIEQAHIDDQPALDRSRPWLTGFARMDPAKGQVTNMELQLRIVRKMVEQGAPEELIPLTIIAGNGATDDPDKKGMSNKLMEERRTTYADISKYIIILGLDHDYDGASTLIGDSAWLVNLPEAEGWEHRIEEAQLKGTPVIHSNAGGLGALHRGKDGEGGKMVADLDNMDAELERIADEVVKDLMNPDLYAKRVEQTLKWAREFIEPELTTVADVIRLARILNGKGDKTWLISEILEQEKITNRMHRKLTNSRLGRLGKAKAA